MTVPSRVAGALDRAGVAEGAHLLVALSGGLDSCVLLHVLRFQVLGRYRLSAAHFDHRLRPESSDDALWVRGLCAAWGVDLISEASDSVPASEEAARQARYAFLERARAASGAEVVLTAHHADDQAETVLFRALRGTGLTGLAGIPLRRDPSVVRPLLDVWRQELEEYALHARVGWRPDVTNEQTHLARNALRHLILPEIEFLVAPGARTALVRLARLAGSEEKAWDEILERVLPELSDEPVPGGVRVDRDALLALPEALRARIIRTLARRAGVDLDETGTRLAMQFSSSGRSGGRIDLGRGVVLSRSLDRLEFARSFHAPTDRPLTIPGFDPGRGDAWVGGRRVPVAWGGPDVELRDAVAELSLTSDRFPIVVRARRPGDRIRLGGGSKKLKQLFLDARIPLQDRGMVPVVSDARGEVLWVPGVAKAEESGAGEAVRTFRIGIG